MSSWTRGPGRLRLHRPIDVLLSGIAMPVVLPVILVAAAVVRATSSGAGFFRQDRVGRGGELFRIWKLRTMVQVDPGVTREEWSSVTSGDDVRLTNVGRRLRRWKLDELPQLINVLRGEMALVGPRPDVEGFVDSLTDGDSLVRDVRPGITGPATVLLRNEQIYLGALGDPTAFSDDVLFKAKVRINLAWIHNGTLLDDLRLLLLTVGLEDERVLHSMIQKWEPGILQAEPVAEVLRVFDLVPLRSSARAA